MPRFEGFAPTAYVLRAALQVAGAYRLQVVAQRFQGPHGSAHLVAWSNERATAEAYNLGGYQLLYLTKGAPKSPHDWAFLERSAPSTIELAGMRELGADLELTVIRTVAKKTLVGKEFTALTRALDAGCERGVELNGTVYPNMRYARELESQPRQWWCDLAACDEDHPGVAVVGVGRRRAIASY